MRHLESVIAGRRPVAEAADAALMTTTAQANAAAGKAMAGKTASDKAAAGKTATGKAGAGKDAPAVATGLETAA
jgi:hypothetical protein